MNVLMVTSDASALTDGSEAQSLLRQLSAGTNRLMVVVINSRAAPSVARKLSDSLWIFPTNSLVPSIASLDVLRVVSDEIFFQNKLQADLIVAHEPILAGFAAALLALRYKKPLNIHVGYGLFSKQFTQQSVSALVRSIFARIVIGRANTISVTQEKDKETLEAMAPSRPDRITLIPRYIDVAAIQAEPIKDADDLHLKYTQFRAIILVVAPLTRDHNAQVAIQSLAEVSKYYQNIGLVIVGEGPRKSFLKRHAEALAIGEKVIFENARTDLVTYYKTARLLMVPSLTEEYGTTIEDAAAAGCAIVSSPVGIAPHIITQRESGFIANPEIASEFWNAADLLIHNEALWGDVKKNIVASVQAYMSTDKDEYLKLYKVSWQAAIAAVRPA